MRFLSATALALLAAHSAAANPAPTLPKTIRNPARQALYDSGAMHMSIMAAKESTFTRQRAEGAYNSSQYPDINAQAATKCIGGMAGAYRCSNMDLYAFLSHASLGSATGEGSSTWGWTSPEGREIVVVGQADGAAFAEIMADGSLVYLGRLPRQSSNSIWRGMYKIVGSCSEILTCLEIRVYDHYAIIGSEATNHHIQIFDLTKLLTVTTPKVFSTSTDLTGLFRGLPTGRTHNVVVNEEMKYIVSVGAQPRTSACAAGLIFIDVTDPAAPTTPGCAAQDGYVHDAQCLVYRGPDTAYAGKDICYGYNEDTLTIYDVTSKTAPKVISRTTYTGASYTHQGWVLDTANQEYLILDDEYDEYDGVGPAADGYPGELLPRASTKTESPLTSSSVVTYIWNIKSLAKPILTGYYKSGQKSIDHKYAHRATPFPHQYVANGKAYQSNYAAGLRVLDISSIPTDPTGGSVKEIGYFDVYPEDDGSDGLTDFVGSWASYGLFKSGYIAVNSIERGLFVVKLAS
ncbi:hypothetical protein EDC01DRAFT_636676 [Geopyxis carbonaria]|nr:hypothetical protein EDC01DRAFT_636676 [Geopyxis carbonaria]